MCTIVRVGVFVLPFRRPFAFDTYPFELVRFRYTVSSFVFDLFVFDIAFVSKCKSENGNGVIPTDSDHFQPTTIASHPLCYQGVKPQSQHFAHQYTPNVVLVCYIALSLSLFTLRLEEETNRSSMNSFVCVYIHRPQNHIKPYWVRNRL